MAAVPHTAHCPILFIFFSVLRLIPQIQEIEVLADDLGGMRAEFDDLDPAQDQSARVGAYSGVPWLNTVY